jgi:hypothetical protein
MARILAQRWTAHLAEVECCMSFCQSRPACRAVLDVMLRQNALRRQYHPSNGGFLDILLMFLSWPRDEGSLRMFRRILACKRSRETLVVRACVQLSCDSPAAVCLRHPQDSGSWAFGTPWIFANK